MKKLDNSVPLIVEEHPSDYDGYPFITLIQYRDDYYLTIVDNVDIKSIQAYVLDLCGPENVDEQQLVTIALQWWKNNKNNFPFSVEISRSMENSNMGNIYKKFNIDYVKRVIGPLTKFNMSGSVNVKRRRRKAIPSGMEVHYHNS